MVKLHRRPPVPPELASQLRHPVAFAPSPKLGAFAYAHFIDPGGHLANPDHAHLRGASIGWLWTNAPNQRGGLAIVGTAEFPKQRQGGLWTRARAAYQLERWFGHLPDFLVTIDAVYAARVNDAGFCALLEHELYHCGQAENENGPRFTKEGKPVWSMRGHDVEEFVGIVRRYGARAGAGRTLELVEAAQRAPEIAPALVTAACGTDRCRVRIAA